MISLFLDTFYIVRILDYQAEGIRRGGGQKGGRGEKGEGGLRKGREERKGEGEVGGRRKGERGERGGGRKGEGEGRKGEMGERDLCTLSFMTIPLERAGYNLRFKKLKPTAITFPQACSYKIRHPKSIFLKKYCKLSAPHF